MTDYVGGARPNLGLAGNIDRSYLSIFIPSGVQLNVVSLDGARVKEVDNAPEPGAAPGAFTG